MSRCSEADWGVLEAEPDPAGVERQCFTVPAVMFLEMDPREEPPDESQNLPATLELFPSAGSADPLRFWSSSRGLTISTKAKFSLVLFRFSSNSVIFN